jgi:protein gp37
MGAKTDIAYADHTFNAWHGCAPVSDGCAHCFAKTFTEGPYGTPCFGSLPRRFFGEKHWREPERWNRAAVKAGKPRRVLCGSMLDVFEDRPELVASRLALLDLIRSTPALDWMVLTKRPENFAALRASEGWPENMWLGVTAENQIEAERRIPLLLAETAAVRWVSVEPQLEAIDLRRWLGRIGWVVCGGESGRSARAFHVEWMNDLVKQCRHKGTPIYCKQIGAKPFSVGQPMKLTDPAGGDPSAWPDSVLRNRQFPFGDS